MATLRDRFRAALQVFRAGYPQQRGAIQAKGAPFMVWPEWRTARADWRMVDLEGYVEEGFSLNTLIYSAVMYKARAASTPPLRAYAGDPDSPELLPPDHPLSRFVARPNPSQSWREFQMLRTVYFNLSGESFVWLERKGGERGVPSAAYVLNPQRTYIVPDRKAGRGVIGYVYVPEGKAIDDGFPLVPQDVIHTKLPNPADPLDGDGYGFSPLSPLARSGDVDNMITKFLQLFFQRGAVVTGLLSFDKSLHDDVVAQIKQRWQDIYGGFENWTDVGVLDQGGKYERVGMNFDEMGFDSLDERNESRVLGPFGVPPILIGSRLGLMRCLPGDARVMTLSGPRFIKDIRPGEKIWSMKDGRLVEKTVTWQGQTGELPLYEIKTKNRTLRASGNHPVLVRIPGFVGGTSNANRHASYGWKTVSELSLSDQLVQVKHYPDQGKSTLPDGSQATTEFVQFCGAMIGDGTIGDGTIRMAMPPNDRSFPFYRSAAEVLFTKQPYSTQLPSPVTVSERERDFGFRTKSGANLLIDLGISGTAKTKRVPGWVFELSRDLRLAFLAGIVDSDGSIDSRGTLGITSASRDLILDIRDLLISVGIQCSNVYHHIYGPNVLPNPGKQDEYHNYAITASSAKQISDIPFADPLYRGRVNRNINRYKSDGKDAKSAGLGDEFGFYQITSLRVLPEIVPVYDITVDDGHSFVADGVLVHNSTYANYGEARTAFWEDTMLSELGLFEDDYKYYLQSDDGGFVAFDYSDVPALRKDITAQVAAWAQLVDRGVPKNSAAQVVGLDLPTLVDGAVGYMPISLIPISASRPAAPLPATTTPAGDSNQGAAEAEGDTRDSGKARKVGWSQEQKAAHWKAVDSIARSWEPKFSATAADDFEADRRGVLAILYDGRAKSVQRKATIDWEQIAGEVADFLKGASQQLWRKTFAPLVRGVVTAQGKRWSANLGLQFDVANLEAVDWFNNYTLVFAQQVGQTTMDDVGQILAQAQLEGASIPQVQTQLDALFDRYIDAALPDDPDWQWWTDRTPAYRREMIARTETMRSSNAGSDQIFKDWGVGKKEWLSTPDNRTRTYAAGDEFDHLEANGQVVGIDEAFTVSGEALEFPGDPNGSPGNVINCRCTELPVMPEGV